MSDDHEQNAMKIQQALDELFSATWIAADYADLLAESYSQEEGKGPTPHFLEEHLPQMLRQQAVRQMDALEELQKAIGWESYKFGQNTSSASSP